MIVDPPLRWKRNLLPSDSNRRVRVNINIICVRSVVVISLGTSGTCDSDRKHTTEIVVSFDVDTARSYFLPYCFYNEESRAVARTLVRGRKFKRFERVRTLIMGRVSGGWFLKYAHAGSRWEISTILKLWTHYRTRAPATSRYPYCTPFARVPAFAT